MSRLRILVLARAANPESISLNLEGYSHSEALAQLNAVTLVTRSCNEEALCRTQAPFHAIEAIKMPWLEALYAWSIRRIFNYNYHSRALTPLLYPFSLAFEWRAWRRMRIRIIAGEFDVVLRLLPANPVLPSPFPSFQRNCSIPFVIGPPNSGLPWPPGFSQLKKQRERIAGPGNLYRFLRFARSTNRHATAIMATLFISALKESSRL